MKIPLTPALLKFIISKGFRYCYSRTICVNAKETDVSITLTPVKRVPHIKRLPKAYDTFFNMCKEPVQMAAGVDRTVIFLNLKQNYLHTYENN